MREVPPAHALADERDLGLGLDRHLRLDPAGDAGHGCAGELRQRRPAVAEDPGIAVLVGADRSREPEVVDGRGEHVLRPRVAGILEVVVDAVERRARLRVLELEAWGDERPRAVRAENERDRPLGRDEGEARVVEDVRRIEEHDTGEALGMSMGEQGVTAAGVLLRCDRDRRDHRCGA